jgi:hypothetical protein
MKKPSLFKSATGAVALWAASAAQAALTPLAPACTATISNPTWSDCAVAFAAGNDKFSNNPGATSGTLNFDFTIDTPFVLSLNGGNAFSLFYFDAAGAPPSAVGFTTLGVSVNDNDGGSEQSRASVYGAKMVPGVPEPQTLAMMLAGLAAFGFLAARRRQR